MSEEVIKKLSEELFNAKLDYENRGYLNTSGLTMSQRLRQRAEYDYSKTLMLHAKKKLEYAIKYFSNKDIEITHDTDRVLKHDGNG